MGYHSLVKVFGIIVLKITLLTILCQMTNVFGLSNFVIESNWSVNGLVTP